MATIVIGTLRALLSADTANFESGMRKASAATKGFTATSKDVTRAAQSIGAAFAAMNIGAAASASAKRLSEIADAAERIGISAEAVQKLGFAAQQGGSSIEAVGNSIRFMADMLGNEKQATALMERLGLNLAEIKAKSPDQAFTAIADAIARIPDPLERSDIATNAFGRGALQLMPAILAGFTEIGNQASVMSNETVAAGDKTDDALAKMQLRMENLKAQALTPLVNAFVMLPESVQVTLGAIGQLMPSLEALAIGVLALGGPKGALAVLMASFSGIATFLTTTLPAAFTAIITFLGPQGLIAVGVIALGLVWYKWGEDIKRIVAAVYTAIRSYLVDKFNAVVASIKSKIDAITGYFKSMYDAVVGQSFVPDMIDRIAAEFGRLDGVMVNPTDIATSAIESAFSRMSSRVQGIVDDLLTKVKGWLSDFADRYLPGWAKDVLSFVGGGGSGEGGSQFQMGTTDYPGANNEVDKWLDRAAPYMLSNPITAGIWAGAKLLNWGISEKGWFRGGEEAMHVNPRRDKFTAQWGGPHGLAAWLTSRTGQPGGGALFEALRSADSVKEFTAAQSAIAAFARRNGKSVRSFAMGGFVPPGEVVPAILHGGTHGEVITPVGHGGATRIDLTINAMDGADVRRVFKGHIIPLLKQALVLNDGDLRTTVRREAMA